MIDTPQTVICGVYYAKKQEQDPVPRHRVFLRPVRLFRRT